MTDPTPRGARRAPVLRGLASLLGASLGLALPTAVAAQESCGETLDPRTYGPAWVESLAEAVERDAAFGAGLRVEAGAPARRPGAWIVPSTRATGIPHSGRHVAINEWGDLRMGIGFPAAVELVGLWTAGQAERGVWPSALRALGYREDVRVAVSEWRTEFAAQPRWWQLDFEDVDRVEFEALPAIDGAAWFAIDDLTYELADGGAPVVVDFEDCEYRQRLTGSGYAGLDWERGTGLERSSAEVDEALPAPHMPPEGSDALGGGTSAGPSAGPGAGFLGGSGTAPVLVYDFAGARRFHHGDASYPPDTCGAIGPAHFAEILNRTFTVYDRFNGSELAWMNLDAFLPGTLGDPRILFDQHSGRWVAISSDFGDSIQLAVSLTDDATGDWFKTEFVVSQGTDAGCHADYPTLGVDERGIYIGAFMAPGCGYTLFVLDKAPLVDVSPSLGTITAFRGLEFSGALQPAHTYGPSDGEYVVSVSGTDEIRVRRVDPPMTSPTLVTVGLATVSVHASPPSFPALGSLTPLFGVGDRLLNAVYRDGSIWTTNTVRVNDRAAVRWYELEAATATLIQEGTVADPERHYYFPSIAVNADGDAVLGCSGSSPTEYASAYFTGRLASDVPGEMAPPTLYRAGSAAYNVLDGSGRNRWGDYSHTTLDPLDERTIWTLQEYTHVTDVWGTWVGALEFGGTVVCPDPVSYCSTSPNSVGAGATMNFGGSPSASLADLLLVANSCPPNRTGVFFYGASQTSMPFGDGLRCVGGPVHRLPPVVTDFFGDAGLAVDFDNPPTGSGPGAFTVGSTWNIQFWYEDPAAGGSGFNLTDGLQLTICP